LGALFEDFPAVFEGGVGFQVFLKDLQGDPSEATGLGVATSE